MTFKSPFRFKTAVREHGDSSEPVVAAASNVERETTGLAKRLAILDAVAHRSPDLVVVLNRHREVLYANPVARVTLRLSDEHGGDAPLFDRLQPDDAKRLGRHLAKLLRSPGATIEETVRVVSDGGEERELEIVLTNLLDRGDVAAIVVNGRDVSERQALVAQNEALDEWYRRLAMNSGDLNAVVDTEAMMKYVSPSNVKFSGQAAVERVGRSAFDGVHPHDEPAARQFFRENVEGGGTSAPAVYRYANAAGGWSFLEIVLTNCLDVPGVEGIIVNARDMTVRTNLSRALTTLTEGNQVLVRATDEETLLVDICEAIVASGAYVVAWVGFKEYDDEKSVTAVVSAGPRGYLDEVRVTWGEDELGRGPTGTAIRTGTVQVFDAVVNARDLVAWRAPAERHGIRTGCAFPLSVAHEIIGALTIYAEEPGAFDPDALALLGELADDLAYGIGRLRDGVRLAKNERLLRESEERFRLAYEQNMAPMLFVDLDDRISSVNDAFCQMVGFSREELLGHDSTPFTHPDDVGITESSLRRVSSGTTGQERYVKRYQRKDGQVLTVEVSRTAARDEDGRIMYYVFSERDVTEEQALIAQLSHQALHDPLTGLANRALFEDRLVQSYSRVLRFGGLGAVFLLGLDDFQGMNDAHGHLIGDQLLVAITQRFATALTSLDTLARLGGDEFLYLAEGLTSTAQAAAIARRLLDVFVEPFEIGGVQVEQRASIGVVVFDGTQRDPAEFIRDADVALYEAKSQGRNRHVVFDHDMHQQAISRFSLVQELHWALQAGDLSMYFQPIMNLERHEVVGFEALMRWHHPERGWVPPAVFIPLAEQSGSILELGAFALREATMVASTWSASSPQRPAPYVAVNLSVLQFHDPKLMQTVDDALAASGLDPSRLIVEITESAMLRDANETSSVIRQLQQRGVNFSLDDFGTGYSSLSYLATLHPKVIKIDQSFVRPTDESARSDALLETILALGEKLEITMLAEGIEEPAQLTRLQQLGCELGQGFLYSPAVASTELAGLLARRPEEWVERFPLTPAEVVPAD